ncbi:acyl-coenzyme A thioesterase 5-like protein [Anopheles sinensis]|uniref:Acyl-coenzyme A thioesterase 5-like protein n=1 Tax=Anopheles sinensis TaxID=74873 RepID=A0A084VE45_ANOSI|nr:acyl-coenzyme A thioesterase 5-like protein [Anopheles sinensis]
MASAKVSENPASQQIRSRCPGKTPDSGRWVPQQTPELRQKASASGKRRDPIRNGKIQMSMAHQSGPLQPVPAVPDVAPVSGCINSS